MKNEDLLPETLTQFLFHQPLEEMGEITDQELIELSAYGLSVGAEMGQPLLILKALKQDLSLPIPLNPLEAGITLAQSNKTIAPVSPHKATAALLKALGMQIEKCVFVEIKNSHQFVKLFVSGHPAVRSLKLKAEEVLSLCLYLEVPLYTTREFIARSRVMVAEIDEQRRELLNNPGLLSKNHSYIN
jgi:hypothetical protein